MKIDTLKTNFVPADICTAFDHETIGSKVLDVTAFLDALLIEVINHDASKDGAPGQHVVKMPESSFSTVSGGTGKRTQDCDDYVIRQYREGPKMFLKREFADPVKSLAVIVYTRQAYLDDPDNALRSPESLAIEIGDGTHVMVAVLASTTEGVSPVAPYRFVHNLAGGNNSYKVPEPEDVDGCDKGLWQDAVVGWADEIVQGAKESLEYWKDITTVAD